jgi:oligoribonuclease
MIVWIDTETTGLDPHNGQLLEIAVLVTDDDYNELWSSQRLIQNPELDPTAWHEKVLAMHTKSGLLADLQAGREAGVLAWQTPEAVEAHLIKILTGKFGVDELRKAPLGGSSVQFDREWLKIHMPDLITLLHYRNADVSGVGEFLKRDNPKTEARRRAQNPSAVVAHRALDDIRYSVAQARFYSREVFSPSLWTRLKRLFG